MRTSLLISLLLTLAFGCAVDGASPTEETLELDPLNDLNVAKGDGLGGVNELGELPFGGTLESTFDQDFQFFSFEFSAREGAKVSVEVTRRGSASRLDTQLYLYRLSAGQDPARIATDDESGWGQLSEIEDFELWSEDRYAVVIGTQDHNGRGDFRVELRCESDACEPIVPGPVPGDASGGCPDAMRDLVFECLEDMAPEYGHDTPFSEMTTEVCGTEADLELLREDWCGGAAWCQSDEIIDSCRIWSRATFPTKARTRNLGSALVGELLDEVYDNLQCNSGIIDAGCSLEATQVEVNGTPSLEALLEEARFESPIGPGVAPQTSLGRDAYDAFVDLHDSEAQFEEFFEREGYDLGEARFITGQSMYDFQWAWGDCTMDLMVVDFPSADEAFVFQSLFCAD